MPKPSLLLLLCLLPYPVVALDSYTYEVVDKQAQPRALFTQGFEINDGQLYISSGKYGKSKLLRFNLATGKLEASKRVSNRYFAEGLTVLNDRIFQLTWRAKTMLIYAQTDLERSGMHTLPGEGWGLTNNGESLIYSDGSATLRYMDPHSGSIEQHITVLENGKPLGRLNELEWINGSIWANVWLTNRVVVIDPNSGKVTASIDLAGLLPERERRTGTDVLNGIAFDRQREAIWVTGKHWPWRYQIAVKPLPAAVKRPSVGVLPSSK